MKPTRAYIGSAFLLLCLSGCGISGAGATPSSESSRPTPKPAETTAVVGTPRQTPVTTANPKPPPTPTLARTTTPETGSPAIRYVWAHGPFVGLTPGTYFIDPDGKSSTPLRVVFDVAAKGWSAWIGAAKFSDAGHVGLSITTVANLVTDGCHDHTWADPPVGPGVADLADALAKLAPFELTSAPTDVTKYGYSGMHLGLEVPDLAVDGEAEHGHFVGCTDGDLKSWVAFIDAASPGDAFYGYTGPGYVEEFWILDVQGTRLMIAAETSAGSPSEDIEERQAILDSIRIEQ